MNMEVWDRKSWRNSYPLCYRGTIYDQGQRLHEAGRFGMRLGMGLKREGCEAWGVEQEKWMEKQRANEQA